MLSRETIRKSIRSGDINITPLNEDMFKEASYTFRLGSRLRLMKAGNPIDLRLAKPTYDDLQIGEGYLLQPGKFILGETLEKLKLSKQIGCILSNRGSTAQIGLDVIQSSIFAEPLTDAPQTLEISNHSRISIVLYEGMPIVKGLFFDVR